MTCLLFSIPLLLTTPLAHAGPDRALAYHGDFVTHPGFSGRLAWPLATHPKRGLQFETELGAWWHPGNMTALYARTGVAAHLYGKRSGSVGAFVHTGLARGFWTSPSYSVAQDQVSRTPLSGGQWWLVSSGLSFGHDLALTDHSRWFIRPQLGLRAPTFHGVGIDVAVQVGIQFGGAQ